MIIISKGIQQNFISLLKNSLEKLNKNRMSAELSQDRNNSAQIAENQFSAVYVTTPNEEVAKTIAQGLVRRKIAACVNIIPKITSIYEWEGQINEDSEVLMMIKTKSSKFEELTEFVKKNHPYTVCEVIAVPILQGNPDYLKWMDKTSIPEAENFNKLHKEKVDLKNLQMP